MSTNRDERTRREYLDALGVPVWRARGTPDPAEEAPLPDATHGFDSGADAALLDWDALRATVSGCTRCELHQSRTQTVFGVGNDAADLLVIGEAPGAEEDRRGEPFVGRAGKLLDEMLRAIGLDRNTVFIANVLKCRPPGNRDPKQAEADSCRPYLDRQIDLIQPRVILAVGRIAAQQLLGEDLPLGRMRGKQHVLGEHQIPVVVTYHPAYLLRSPSQKRKSWQDLCLARDLLQKAAA